MMDYRSIESVGFNEFHGISEVGGRGEGGNALGLGDAVALDLIKGHLTESSYIPVSRGLVGGDDPKNWYRPLLGYDSSKESHLVAKIQPFKAGGYEVTVLRLDLKGLAHSSDRDRRKGKREKGDQNENDVISSQNRAKKTLRHKIKSMGCDRLLTLTIREKEGDGFRTVEDWKAIWEKFNKMLKRAGSALDYVAVLERHGKGNYHLHAAIVGRASVKILRKVWYVCLGGKGDEKGGNTPGNVDIKFKPGITEHKRRAGLAKYVSKYISKQMDQTEFNKKRYWSSRHKLPDAVRYILKSDRTIESLVELADMLGLSLGGLFFPKRTYMFNDVDGAWFSFDDDLLAPVPF